MPLSYLQERTLKRVTANASIRGVRWTRAHDRGTASTLASLHRRGLLARRHSGLLRCWEYTTLDFFDDWDRNGDSG